ncbi:MAG: amidohydrolase family protein [Candidatus Methanofastidiosia archaeon]
MHEILVLCLSFILLLGSLAGCLRNTTGPIESPEDEKSRVIQFIDTHIHLDGIYRSKATLVKDYETATENLIALMDRYDIDKALIMPPPQGPRQPGAYDYQNLLGVMRKHSNRLYLVGGGGTLNPFINDTEEVEVTEELRAEFEEMAEELIAAGAVAFGEMTALHLCMSERHHFIETPPDHPLFLLLADIAARHDVPIDLHMEAVSEEMPTPSGLLQKCSKNPSTLPATIPAFERLLAHNRDAKIVWQHIGWDNTGNMTVELLRRLLEEHSNLYLSLKIEERGFMVGSQKPMPNRIVDEKWQVRSEWLELIGDFPDRFMIGSDEFIGIPGRTPRRPQSFEETWSILNQLSEDLAYKVGYENAARIYLKVSSDEIEATQSYQPSKQEEIQGAVSAGVERWNLGLDDRTTKNLRVNIRKFSEVFYE